MPREISTNDLIELKIAFNESSFANFRINKNQFRNLFKRVKFSLNDSELQLLFFAVKSDKNGCIDFNEFLNRMSNDHCSEINEKTFLENLFAYLDRNQNGLIDFDEFKQIGELFDDYIREEELKEYFDEVDLNGDATISFEEFEQNSSLVLMSKFFVDLIVDVDESVKEIFNYLDTDKDGYLSFKEFKLLAQLDEFKEMDEIDFRECFDQMDQDNDGKITLKEFNNIIQDDDEEDDEEDDEDEFLEKLKDFSSRRASVREKINRSSLTVVEESQDF